MRKHGAKGEWTALHNEVYEGRRDIAELLIQKGANVNAKTSSGQTRLQLAKPRRNTVAIEVLRKHGAKEESPDSPI